MSTFMMPSLGADMTEGTLLEWLVHPGDAVRRGDVVAVVETAKSTIEVECFDSGTVERLLVEPGMTVPVGTPLAQIGTAAPGPAAPVPAATGPPLPVAAPLDAVHSPLVRRLAAEAGIELALVHGTGPAGAVTRADVQRAAAAQTAGRAAAAAATRPAARPAEPTRPRVTPFARRLAAELGVDLAGVAASGASGVIRAAEVRQAAGAPVRPAPAEAARPTARDRAAAMRHAIAELMSRSKREIPHYYLSTTIDLASAEAWRHDHNRRCPVAERLVSAALLLKAAARAAREVPQLNGFWIEGHFVPAPAVHLGVAIALHGGGLIAPALHDADTLALPDLMAQLKDLTWRARGGRLRGSQTTDSTLTVTSLGDQGVEEVFGVIYPPQVALVGFGRVTMRPCAVGGLLGIHPAVTATVSADHRASDGAVGARYLAAVDRLLQQPEEL